jgi:hypothetical protein
VQRPRRGKDFIASRTSKKDWIILAFAFSYSPAISESRLREEAGIGVKGTQKRRFFDAFWQEMAVFGAKTGDFWALLFTES